MTKLVAKVEGIVSPLRLEISLKHKPTRGVQIGSFLSAAANKCLQEGRAAMAPTDSALGDNQE